MTARVIRQGQAPAKKVAKTTSKKRVGIASSSFGMRTSAGYILYGAGTLFFWHIPRFIGHVINAGLNKVGVNTIPRKLMAGVVATGGVAGTSFIEVDSDHFVRYMEAGAKDGYHQVCRDPRILRANPLTAAWARGFGDAKVPLARQFRTTTSNMQLHYISAMQGIHSGVSPAVLYLISYKETGFRDVVANNSTARGPYQSITSTHLHNLLKYAKSTKAYRDAKTRIDAGTANDRDHSLISAIDATVSIYRDHKAQLLQDIKDQKISLHTQMALSLVNDPVFSGQIMAEKIAVEAPYLLDINLKGKSLDEIVIRSARFYRSYLLGDRGAALLGKILTDAPQTRISDIEAMKKVLKPHVKAKHLDRMARYFSRVARINRGVFTRGVGVTAETYAQQIEDYIVRESKLVTGILAQYYGPTATTQSICVEDPSKIVGKTIPVYRGVGHFADFHIKGVWPSYQRDLGGLWKGIISIGGSDQPSQEYRDINELMRKLELVPA